jgi:avermitilol synthase
MLEHVEIISAAEHAARRPVVPPSFALRFPATWRPNPLENVHARSIEVETLTWLASHGIGVTAEEQDKLRRFDCAKYGGYSLPLAPHAETLLVTEFISLWLFWDDLQVEESQDWDVDSFYQALVGASDASSRYVAAWADLGRRLRSRQSATWVRKLGTTMRQWLDNAKVETAMAAAFRGGQHPGFDRLFETRTVSIGMYPTFHLVELADRFELPDAFWEHPLSHELRRLASRLVGLGNDLGGIAKDIKSRWLNLVVVAAEEWKLPIQDAFALVVAIHNRDVVAFDSAAASLPSFGARADRDIDRWIQSVRYNVHGFTLWEATAERYQAEKAIVAGTSLTAPITYEELPVLALAKLP